VTATRTVVLVVRLRRSRQVADAPPGIIQGEWAPPGNRPAPTARRSACSSSRPTERRSAVATAASATPEARLPVTKPSSTAQGRLLASRGSGEGHGFALVRPA
jgi:hypothetical protein